MCKENKRTYGIELEGYTDECIRGRDVDGWRLISDGSLNDGAETCEACDGEGEREYECDECYGSGTIECNDCCGSGDVPCGKCDCDGWYYDGDDNEKVECEDCGGSGYVTCESCDSEGNHTCEDCNDGYYRDTCNDCWGEGQYGEGDSGVECVSGICEEGNYESISRIFNYINRYSWYTNEDCGTHVHIGAKDLEPSDLSKLYILANIIEPFIYGISPSERIEGSYAKKTKRDMVEYLIDRGDEVTLQDIANAYYEYRVNLDGCFSKYDSNRYYGLNLHSWFFRRTIEFRYFQGCEREKTAIAWIDFCIKLVDFAKHVTFEQLIVIGKDFYELDDLDLMIGRVETLLDLDYEYEPCSSYAYEESMRNVASQLRTHNVITRTA